MCTHFEKAVMCAFYAGLLLVGAAHATSANLEVRLTDGNGEAIENAVVVVDASAMADGEPQETAIVDQIDKTFVPHVIAVEVGTLINFPNSDDIRHHVYSFSEAKSFELPLYKGTPAEPVLFDRAGVVALGCNIHDHMSAYIYVSESPHFAVADSDGIARLANLPPGTHTVEVWHPRQTDQTEPLTVELKAGRSATIDIELELRPEIQIQRGPATRRRRY